jgi:hypothetical protein
MRLVGYMIRAPMSLEKMSYDDQGSPCGTRTWLCSENPPQCRQRVS